MLQHVTLQVLVSEILNCKPVSLGWYEEIAFLHGVLKLLLNSKDPSNQCSCSTFTLRLRFRVYGLSV